MTGRLARLEQEYAALEPWLVRGLSERDELMDALPGLIAVARAAEDVAEVLRGGPALYDADDLDDAAGALRVALRHLNGDET